MAVRLAIGRCPVSGGHYWLDLVFSGYNKSPRRFPDSGVRRFSELQGLITAASSLASWSPSNRSSPGPYLNILNFLSKSNTHAENCTNCWVLGSVHFFQNGHLCRSSTQIRKQFFILFTHGSNIFDVVCWGKYMTISFCLFFLMWRL